MIHDTFLKVEKNGKAIVTIDKFREILTRFGFFLNETDSLRVMQRFDKHMRGFVSYEEFFTFVAEWGKQRGTSNTSEVPMSIDEYKLVAKKALEESNESDVTRRALVELTEMLRAREGFDKRLMMELGKLTKGAGKATAVEIRQALANLGQEVEQGNIDRCVRFHRERTNEDGTEGRVDIVKFINSMTVTYYKLTK
jgi:Ca2+-binding EF-hand superfamily protein